MNEVVSNQRELPEGQIFHSGRQDRSWRSMLRTGMIERGLGELEECRQGHYIEIRIALGSTLRHVFPTISSKRPPNLLYPMGFHTKILVGLELPQTKSSPLGRLSG